MVIANKHHAGIHIKNQQLHEKQELFYWSKSNSQQEVDFLAQQDDYLLPIECKAEENLKSKSLNSFINEHNIRHAVKVSMKEYHDKNYTIKTYGKFRGFGPLATAKFSSCFNSKKNPGDTKR